MKTTMTLIVAAIMAAGTLSAFAQSSALEELMRRRAAEQAALGGSTTPEDSTVPSTSSTGATESSIVSRPPEQIMVDPSIMAEPVISDQLSTNGITMNFNQAPLSVVLRYMSSAAGFHIVLDTQPRGYVTIISTHPMTKEESVDLLNSVLNKNGLAAVQKGDTLTIMDKTDARTSSMLAVQTWNGVPSSIPDNDVMSTWILPIRFVDAQQLTTDLSIFISPQAYVIANASANSIIITDIQANIRHLTEIIKAIDSSAEGETIIRVFKLLYANPSDVASALSSTFPSNTGGRGGGGGGGGFTLTARGGRGGASGSASRISKQTQVIATADLRTQSVIVSAEKNMMDQIEATVRELDVSSTHDPDVFVMDLPNGADPMAVVQVLQQTFPTGNNQNRNNVGNNNTSPLDQRRTRAAQQMTVGGSTGTSLNSSGNRTGGRGAFN